MEKLNLSTPGEMKMKRIIAPEQKQLSLSIREKLSKLTHQFQLVLRSKPDQIRSLLLLYRNFLVFKERLEEHLKHEQVLIHTLAQEVKEENFNKPAPFYSGRSIIPEKRLLQLENELSGLLNTLNTIREKYKAIKNEMGGLGKFFKELESLNLFLNDHKNSLKNIFSQKITRPHYDLNFHLEAS
jgi:hypothetical protein